MGRLSLSEFLNSDDEGFTFSRAVDEGFWQKVISRLKEVYCVY